MLMINCARGRVRREQALRWNRCSAASSAAPVSY